ncbi:autotransporter outer membrane beta-barrel domain-containing protein [Parapedobacter koreensis]|uniref:Uncharacterized protein n=1 Tax=Parapedobacter koreensis TaxID=332977 RepID=A0A1H7QN55_9SPHI|nr:hypothetical protein [Parapedobacter koreensis]SEL49481.1 hypothetical protein SAMN05421740_10624 [Parapedobacter koreensis]
MNNKVRLLVLLLFIFIAPATTFAQQKVRDNTIPGSVLPNKDALLELESNNKGLLHTRVQLRRTDDAAPLSQHRVGMMVYNTATTNDVVPGIYYNNGSRWVLVAAMDDIKPINYNPVTYELSFIDGNDEAQVINLEEVVKATETVTALDYDSAAHVLDYIDEDGVAHTFDFNVGELTYNNTNNTLTYTNEENISVAIPLNNTSLSYDPISGVLAYVNTLGALEEFDFSDIIDRLETVTVLSYDANAHVLTYIDEDKVTHTFSLDVGRLTYNKPTNTLTYTAEDGTVLTIPLNETGLTYNASTGILTYTNSLGIEQKIDLNASNIAYDNTASGLAATDVQEAIDELKAAFGDLDLVDNTDGSFSLTDPEGNVLATVSKADLTDEGDGLYTFTNNDGSDVQFDVRTVEVAFDAAANVYNFLDNEDNIIATIDLNASNIAYDNTASGLAATDVQEAIDELKAAFGDLDLVDNTDGSFSLTDPEGNVLATVSKADLTDEGDGLYTFTNNDGSDVQFDVRTVEVAFDAAANVYNFLDNEDNIIATIDVTPKVTNGLQIDATTHEVKLGGELTEETEITTTATNTLAISGLQPGDETEDRIVVVDGDGVLKTIPAIIPSAIREEDSNYEAIATDETILVNATGGDITITLPDDVETGKKYTIKKIDTSNNEVIINGNGTTIDGQNTITGTLPYQGWTVQFDGTRWWVISRI